MPYLIIILFYLSIPSLSFSAPIKNFTAHYDLYYNEAYIGKTTRRLTNTNNILRFSSVSKTDGIASWFFDITITENSKLRYQDNRLNFLSYNYNETKNDKNKSYELHIENGNKIYNSHTKKLYPLETDVHDALGFTVAIMQDMQNGKRELKYSILSKNKLKQYTLKFIKKEKIQNNGNNLTVFKMEHFNPQTKERFTVWCDENLGFLPIRIHSINRKGNVSLLNLTQLNAKVFNLELPEEESD